MTNGYDRATTLWGCAISLFSSLVPRLSHTLTTIEVFIEHIPRAERLQDTVQLATIGVTSLPAPMHIAIAYTVFVYGHIQGVGVTAYRI